MPDPAEEIERRRQHQRQQAWEASAAARRRSKALKALIRQGKLDALDVVAGRLTDATVSAEVESIIGRWTVSALLRAVPYIGEVRAHEVMVAAKVSPKLKVSALTYERRGELARLVELAKR